MKKELKALLPYVFAMIIIFYVLPLTIIDTGSAIFILLLAVPVLTLVISVIYGIKQGFICWLPASVVLLFAPTVFIFYNISAWVYIVFYAIISVIGVSVGSFFHRKK